MFCSLCTACETAPVNLVGKWTVAMESVQMIWPNQPIKRGTLTLRADGSFDAHSLPAMLVRFDSVEDGTLYRGKGTWKVGDEGDIAITFSEAAGDAPVTTPYLFSPIHVERRWRSVFLYYSVGDPDLGHRVKLTRDPGLK